MSYPVFYVPAGDVLPVFFASYDGGTGASAATTGLAVTDIEIYKDGSVTQRASDAGYVLLDTDGLDFDGLTGINGFSIDTGDNTDAGFYTVGAWFTVVVSAVTVDAQTVSFIACQFRLMPAEAVAGKPKVDVDAWLGTAAATPTVAGVPEVDATHWNGTAVTTPPAVNATQISGDSTAADNLETAFDDTAGAVPWMGILDQGTAQSATGSDIVIRAGATFANDTILGATIMVFGSTQGYWQAALVSDYVGASDTVTVSGAAGYVTPSGTITYKIFATAPSSGGAGLDAAGVRAAVGLASANLDTQLGGIQADTDDIQTRLPAALVSGRMDSSTGAMAANVLTATAIAADAITAAKIADAAIDAATFAASAITSTVLANDAITAAKIADGAIDAATFAAGAITSTVVATGAIDADALATDAANEIADAILDRNMATGTDSGADNTTTRTVRQALRMLRNKASVAAGTLTVTKEDDSTASWTAAITTAAGNPVSVVDPT